MDSSRFNYILFFALSVLIIFSYTLFFSPPAKPPADLAPAKTAETQQDTYAEVFNNPSSPTDPAPFEQPQGRLLTVKTPLYTGVIDTSGGRIVEWRLANYRESTNAASSGVNLFKDAPPEFNSAVSLKGIQVPNPIPFQFDGSEQIDISEGKDEIALYWNAPEGVEIRKTFKIDASGYLIEQRIEVKNNTFQPIAETLFIERYGRVQYKSASDNHSFISMVSGDVERLDSIAKEAVAPIKGTINWFGFADKYFMSVFLPEIGGETQIRISKTADADVLRAVFSYPTDTVPAGSASIHESKLYLGPMDYEVLRALNLGLENSIQYGWIGPLARPVLWFLNVLNGVFQNYGIAIIAITVIIRLVFLPLTVKSMVSMKGMQVKMQELKPKMDALKEKFKDDKATQNTELMKLYTSNGINPLSSLSGCLPMLIQLPVFIALYDVLLYSIELRHSSFLWIGDLAEPEFLFQIPGVGLDFRVLPLLMGVSWYVSQKMTPTTALGPENQLQMKMMEFMPLIFTVMFWGLPSGLILYWTVSNVLSIAQQLYVNRRFAQAGRT